MPLRYVLMNNPPNGVYRVHPGTAADGRRGIWRFCDRRFGEGLEQEVFGDFASGIELI
jgi:hypothetical protein